MSDLPILFDVKGNFTPLDDVAVAALSETQAAAYLAVESACNELKAADDAVAAADKRLMSAIADKHSADDAIERYFPYDASTAFHDLWKENFGRR